jgi:spore maturation protein CgeB
VPIDYNEDFFSQEKEEQKPKIVDKKGNPINLTDRQKNVFYQQAREMKEKIQNSLCTKDECHEPTERNVKKMIESEFKMHPLVEGYRKRMQAIGADEKELDIDKLRRGK